MKDAERQREQEQKNGGGCPEAPQQPTHPDPPVQQDPGTVKFCLEGTGSAAAAFLKGIKEPVAV